MTDHTIALVTGASRGIGFATARALAADGFRVIVTGRCRKATLDELVSTLSDISGAGHWALELDVDDPVSVTTAFQAVFAKERRLDVLVNNAGILEDGLVGMVSATTLDRLLSTNVRGVFLCMQEASRLMVRRRTGSIVNVSSIIGRFGNAGQAAYGATKAAVIGMTLSAAKELGPRGIRVNAVAPGLIRTAMISHLKEAVLAQRTALIPLGRLGEAEDVADVIAFLAGPRASYVSGQILGVDGAMVI